MLIIGIAGGSGSGKTTVVNKIIEALPQNSVALIPQDAYYYDNGHLSQEEKLQINFDHPNSIEFDLLVEHLNALKQGKTIQLPIYSYVTCARSGETIPIAPKRVVIVEGILILGNARLRKLLDIKMFVATDSDNRLMRIIRRDVQERGRNYNDALTHYEKFVKPMHIQFIEPTKLYADLIIPQGGENKVAIDMLVSRIKMNLGDGHLPVITPSES
ncbi:MAG: uridine kinase [Bacteroidetes bacterium CG18_big_fil_WC_8_21_14_2_50_41_14]|nr:MAG: uridine kinase [Bacteroidetes bacterium CG18_big_fil_WC_8_21_14_2_50_41_14]PIY32161.1 MAG: uridine kinase [Bacteroidetes bacterium CG_4_10_14_3_um_filter_42_6]PJB59044.1 MAG: uridine kinase [Bacteroidetes bacterium CG_4_9_14_3_um_filter_41_19]